MNRAQPWERSGSILSLNFLRRLATPKIATPSDNMIANFPYQSNPMFLSPEEWLEHFEYCRTNGHRAWEPATRDELLLAESSGLLQHHPEWLPCATGLRLLGLPPWFGRRQSPFSPRWAERFLQTFIDDPELRSAFWRLMNSEVAG